MTNDADDEPDRKQTSSERLELPGYPPEDPPHGAPPFEHIEDAYRHLMEGLWYAHEQFQDVGDGGLKGARIACRAVARFIAVRHENPELAAPFLAIFKSFEDLQKGIEPELFSKIIEVKERSRSSQRKHVQLTAAVAMEVLMELGDGLERASRYVATKAGKWSQLIDGETTATTIRNWRDACRRKDDPRHEQFLWMKRELLSDDNPRSAVDRLLSDGPHGVPGS